MQPDPRSEVERILAWVRATLDDYEQAAKACLEEVGSTRKGEPYPDGSGIAEMSDYPSYPWGSREAELAFMERFPPQAALALVAAHRKILDMLGYVPGDGANFTLAEQDRAEDVIRLIAAAYAHREGYDPSWRPS